MNGGHKIRVLHVTHNMDFGGTEQVIRQIVNSVDHTSYESSIVCIDGFIGGIGQVMMEEGVDVAAITRRSGFDRRAIASLRAHIKAENINVLHCHQYSPYCYGAIAASGLGLNVIFTEHGRFYPDRFTWKRRVVNQLLFRLADEITCISNATRFALDKFEWIPERHVQVIYNGVASVPVCSKQSKKIRSELGISDTACVLGTISRFDPIKNQVMMLDAFAVVRNEYPDSALIMAGDGPERSALEARAIELGIADSVHFTGFINDIAAYLNAIDIFLLTSFSEGTSMTLLEAMSAGKAVIATAVGGNVEVVENDRSGILIPSNDTQSLVVKLRHLYENAVVRQQLAEEAQRVFSKRFSVQTMVVAYEALYQR